jgi:WD40 repeat protein
MQGYPYRLDLEQQPLKPEKIDHVSATSTAFSADGRWFAAGTHHGAGLKVWRADEKKNNEEQDGEKKHSERHVAVLLPKVRHTYPVFSPDSQILAATVSGQVHLWRVGDWQPLRTITTVGGHFPSFSFSPDSRLISYSRTPYEVCLEETITAKQLATLAAPDGLQTGHMFDHTGTRLLLVHSYPPALRIWDLRLLRDRLASIGLAEGLPDWTPTVMNPAVPKPIELLSDKK